MTAALGLGCPGALFFAVSLAFDYTDCLKQGDLLTCFFPLPTSHREARRLSVSTSDRHVLWKKVFGHATGNRLELDAACLCGNAGLGTAALAARGAALTSVSCRASQATRYSHAFKEERDRSCFRRRIS